MANAQESDDEDMTDEQMFKMDKLLAAVLRTQKDAKDKTKNTKQVNTPHNGHEVLDTVDTSSKHRRLLCCVMSSTPCALM